MQHVDPTQCDPRVPQTLLFDQTRAALRATIAQKRAEAVLRRARNPQKPPFVERRKAPRILGFNGVWTEEMRLAEAAMAARERQRTGEAPTGWGDELSPAVEERLARAAIGAQS